MFEMHKGFQGQLCHLFHQNDSHGVNAKLNWAAHADEEKKICSTPADSNELVNFQLMTGYYGVHADQMSS